ncbi:hypothetical protein [Antarcticirhabdus aurantiaca]|uniref:Uncharacterized protein n=1 Tax=Antarcticirhabdus aurantiaca TaxID=2606717 RepID=A0ACD4NTG0_9HYPH|nr:hypothetical protein [Antarcticirhabdus aurantiaca]WAJ30013.1 hypothetical protein OXU80_07320 [Jeongeuplla avenae]
MEHVAAFMLLVGCSGDVSACQEVPVPMPAYEDVSECQADLPIQMRLSGATDRKLFGACKEVDADVFEQSASVDWRISRDGQLLITFDAAPQVVASR